MEEMNEESVQENERKRPSHVAIALKRADGQEKMCGKKNRHNTETPRKNKIGQQHKFSSFSFFRRTGQTASLADILKIAHALRSRG